jgi:KaiC/GvpD/RAD55 family RecA-like ATPase
MSTTTAVTATTAAAKTEAYPLQLKFGNEVKGGYTPIHELVQGLLTADGISCFYGDSNSGKTFAAIDLAASIARGIDWMGRKTQAGIVLYLAAESPKSVENRVQAYQEHHGVTMPAFVISTSPVNLHKDDKDTQGIIKTIKMLEEEQGQKVRLVVVDTLARVSDGANENSAQDMGPVIARVDAIRKACDVHVMLVHHTGKVADAGARGWSGLRAAVDTEIKVSETTEGRYAEITKNRDLGAKGERIGFKLNVVAIGTTNFGTVATTCVVAPAAAPKKSKKLGEVEGAVLEFVTDAASATKVEVVRHFAGRYEKGPIYRAMKKLIEEGILREAAGAVSVAEEGSADHAASGPAALEDADI